MKGNPVLYKSLVIGVIVLFIGVGIQPAIAIINNGNNNPPEPPDIAGPVRGKPNVEIEYVFVSTDPEDEDVSYYIEWGDGETTGWTDYYPSGEEVVISHTWDKIDWDNLLRAKAKDINGAESDWSEKEIPISKTSDVDDECNLCPKVSKQHIDRIKGLIDRLDTLNTKLSKVSKLNPELEEKYQEISDNIAILKEISKDIKSGWDFPIICNILLITQVVFEFTFAIIYTLSLMSSQYNRPTQSKILLFCSVPFYVFVLTNFVILKALKCE